MDTMEPGKDRDTQRPTRTPESGPVSPLLPSARQRLQDDLPPSEWGRTSSALTPEGLIADQSLAQAIRDQALLLPSLYQKVLELYYFQGKRLGEIARICGRSEEDIARIHAQCALAVQLAMKHFRPGL